MNLLLSYPIWKIDLVHQNKQPKALFLIYTPNDRAFVQLLVRIHDIYISSPNCTQPHFSHTQGEYKFNWFHIAYLIQLQQNIHLKEEQCQMLQFVLQS